MKKYMLMVNSITYALKGRNLLRREGIKAFVERTPDNLDRIGCGYSIYVYDDIERVVDILQKGGIKIIGRREDDAG